MFVWYYYILFSCFFLCLGAATNIHPYVLQVCFRVLVDGRFLKSNGMCVTLTLFQFISSLPFDSQYDRTTCTLSMLDDEKEIAGYNRAITKATFVDFNILAYVRPSELNSFRIHVISNVNSNSTSMPLLTIFQSPVPPTGPIVDIFILCRNNHFTQLLPAA